MADAEMRALIVSDIHSNLEALGSVLRDAESGGGFDSIWSLGDLVGYGPDPEACIDLMRGHGGLRVAGNHDLAVSGRMGLEWFNTYAAAAARWTADRLEEEHVEYLSGLSLRVETDGFTAVHGSPRDPVWEYVVTAESARVTLEGFDTPRCPWSGTLTFRSSAGSREGRPYSTSRRTGRSRLGTSGSSSTRAAWDSPGTETLAPATPSTTRPRARSPIAGSSTTYPRRSGR